MEEMSFEQKLIQAMEQTILNDVQSGKIVSVGYPHINLSGEMQEMLTECIKQADREKIKALIKVQLEEMIAKQIVNSMMTEITNDVKKIIGTKQIREDLRYYLRQQMEECISAVSESEK